MNSQFIIDLSLGIIRHLATGLGGILVADGVIQSSQTNDLIGAIVFLAGVGASALAKWNASRPQNKGASK